MDSRKCVRCKATYPEDQFGFGIRGIKNKSCIICLDREKIYRVKRKCPHGRQKCQCRDCNGACICQHNRVRSNCTDCKSANGICKHNKLKSACKKCKESFCEHKVDRKTCKICDFDGFLCCLVRGRVRAALKSRGSTQYLCDDTNIFKKHIEEQFREGMTWENQGRSSPQTRRWCIDHVTPLGYGNPTLADSIRRLHYLNTRPSWN